MSDKYGNDVRGKSIKIVTRLETVYLKYAKHQKIASVLLNWIKPHMINVIQNTIPEQELKQILWDCKKEIDDLAIQMNLAEELKEVQQLNGDNRQTKFVLDIKENKEALELLP